MRDGLTITLTVKFCLYVCLFFLAPGGVWSEHSGGGVGDNDAGFILGTYKKMFSFGIASKDTGRMTWLQASM